MKLDIFAYADLLNPNNLTVRENIEHALLRKGIIGLSHVPQFETLSRHYVEAARAFSTLPENVKQQYTPNRDAGDTEGYEIGVEWFQDNNGKWKIDDKKASFYAYIHNNYNKNKWPAEYDLKTPYLALGQLIFSATRVLLDALQLNESLGMDLNKLVGLGRLLHYCKEGDHTNDNPDWCGAHFDNGVMTGLMPAYYFREGKEIIEPAEAGLYIIPHGSQQFQKVHVPDKSVLLFQVGDFGQLMSDDRINATKHIVKKTPGNIERFAFALFTDPSHDTIVYPRSRLTQDARYLHNRAEDGGITYRQWQLASYAQYRATAKPLPAVA